MPSAQLFEQSCLDKNKIKSVTIREFTTRFILFCVMPLLMLTLVLAAHHVYILQKHHDREAWTKTHNVLMAIDRDLSARISSLEVLAKSPLLDSPARIDEFFKEAQAFRESFTGHVILADMSTQMIFNTRVPLGSSLPKLPIPKGFAAAQFVIKTGKPAVGDMFLGPIAKEPLVGIVVPVVRSGETRALLLSIIETRQYQKILDNLEFPEGYSVALLDSNKTVMAHRTLSDFNTTATYTDSGRKYFQKSMVSHWEVILEVDPWIYNKTFLIEATGMLLTVIMISFSSILGGRKMGRKLAGFIESLSGEQPFPAFQITISEIEEVRALLDKAALDREMSMEELRINEIRYRTLFEAANVGKSIALPSGEIKVNKAFCQMLGYEEDELKGKKWQDLTAKDDIEPIQKILAQLLNGEKDAARFEKRYIHKDGSYVWGDVSIAIQRDHDGSVLYFITTIVDIMKRKHIEAVLRESEEKYRLLFENMTDGFALHEVMTDEHNLPIDFKFININPAVERLTGLQKEELIGRRVQEITTESTWIEKYGKVALSGEPERFQEYSSSLNKWLEVFAFQPKPGLCAAIFSDITERKKLEDQIRQSQKMEAVGQLAGGVAHDYNNMLSVIIGYAEMVMEKIDKSSDLYPDLTEILNAAERSADITRQLLAFARKQTAVPKIINLNKSVDGLLKMIKRLIGEDIDLAWTPQDGLWLINMDQSQIDQVLVNLCVNARDAISDTGKISIGTENITFDSIYCSDHADFIPGDFIMLSVSDNGCGMSKDNIEKIFEPFFTTKELGRGTGLGLSTVYGIIKQNNGFINVYSEPGIGSIFKVYIPRHYGETEVIQAKDIVQSPVAKGETVLVVEDENSILQLIKQLLEELGYQVITANTPNMAISLAQDYGHRNIHLLITDVIMPEMNGSELAERIRELHYEVKTLFMSGYTADVIGHHGVLEKGVHFISKPISRQLLAIKIREVLG